MSGVPGCKTPVVAACVACVRGTPGSGVQAPPCNCLWHGVGFGNLYMASTDGCACMSHASSVAYVSPSLHVRMAVHSSMYSNGCLQNTFVWAAGHSCVQACCNPAVSSFVPAHWCLECCWWGGSWWHASNGPLARQSWRVTPKATVESPPQCAQQETCGSVVCGAGQTIYPPYPGWA